MMIFLLEDDHDLPLETLTRPSYLTYFRTTSLFTPLMCQIVGIHVKHAKMCQVIRHAKMCKLRLCECMSGTITTTKGSKKLNYKELNT